MVMTIRESPVVAVAELVIRLTPGAVVERAIRLLGHHDKTFLVIVLLVILGCCSPGRPTGERLLVEAAGGVRRDRRAGPGGHRAQYDPRLTDVLPILVGFVTWVVCSRC
jgi:hypothetical protein